ncbi:MAG: SH3 domain-containing protein [Clostridiales bacterium]|nr:SH3 domain-containing protein [Candidatus Blautia equi]
MEGIIMERKAGFSTRKQFLFLSLFLLVSVFTLTFRAAEVHAAQTGYVNYSYLNLRKSATTSSTIVMVLSKNDPVVINKDLGSWYQVTATHLGHNYSGYVATQYITLGRVTTPAPKPTATPTPAAAYNGYVNYNGVNLRYAATTSSAIVVKTSLYDKLSIGAYADGWYKVTVLHNNNKYAGYMAAQYVTRGSAPTAKPTATPTPKPTATPAPAATTTVGYVNNSTLNLRSQPTTSSTRVTVLSLYDPLVLRSYSNGWYRVTASHNGLQYSGYVAAQYVTKGNPPVPVKTGYVNYSYLNLRYSATTSSSIVVTLSRNDRLTLHSYSGGWYKVTAIHNNKSYSGYVSSTYVKVN